MARLVSFKEIEGSHLLRLVITEGEEKWVCFVRERAYAELGRPAKGEEISDEELCTIREEDEYVRCKRKALYMLSICDSSERGLLAKLKAKGFSHKAASEVCREMISLGYINEDAQLERLVLREANEKLFGARKIMARLASKGYSASRIREAIAALCERGEVDFSANASELMKRRLESDAAEEERLALLIKYGYKK